MLIRWIASTDTVVHELVPELRVATQVQHQVLELLEVPEPESAHMVSILRTVPMHLRNC